MPTTYAHYRFGQDVLNKLPDDLKAVINNSLDLYNYGVHGPDLLFYYRSLAYNNKIVCTGREIHHECGKNFFAPAAQIIKKRKYNETELAFLYGYITHFALDIACHGYVNSRVTDLGIPHSTTEAEFDRYLLLKDGVTDNPAGYSPVTHLHPSKSNSKAMLPYYKPYVRINKRKLNETQNAAVFMISFITNPNKYKRFIRKRIMRLGGSYTGGLIMTTSPDKRCTDSNLELERRYAKAIPLAVTLIQDFIPSSKTGTWEQAYDSPFDPMSTKEEIQL